MDIVSADDRAGVSPSLALADAFVSAHPSTSVGLIPCAKDGSSISDWQKTKTKPPRETLFGSCLNRMKAVSPANGTIRAAIFWEGGADAKRREDAVEWKARFEAFVADLRSDLGAPNLPVILVTLGSPKKKVLKKLPYWEVVREQQNAVTLPGVLKIEADGYKRRKDGIHFATSGQLAFGSTLAGLLPAP